MKKDELNKNIEHLKNKIDVLLDVVKRECPDTKSCCLCSDEFIDIFIDTECIECWDAWAEKEASKK